MANFVPPQALPPVRIQDTADIGVNGIKCLVYGGAGQGKTRLAVTAPTWAPPLVLSAESGLLSLKKWHLPYIAIHNMLELEAAYQYIAFNPQANPFGTIMLDSISEIAEVCLAQEMGNTPNGQKAYGEMAKAMMDTLRKFRDLPGRNVVMTAKMDRLKDESTGGIMWGPLMPGQQLDKQLPYLFDEVFHIGTYKTPEGVEYRALRTQPDNQYQAKDRSGSLDYWEQPNLTVIFEKIMRG